VTLLNLAMVALAALGSSGFFAALAIAYHQRASAVQARNFQLRKENARFRLALGYGAQTDDRILPAMAADPNDLLEVLLALPARIPDHERREGQS
jgi:hypothetical protein